MSQKMLDQLNKTEVTTEVKRNKADLQSKIKKQKVLSRFDKVGNLIIESVKMYANNQYIDSVTVTKKELEALKKIQDIKAFRQVLYRLCRKDVLAIDSESEKLNLCNHARARQHCFNPIAKAIGLDKFYVDYSKDETSDSIKKANKSTQDAINKKALGASKKQKASKKK